MLPENVFIDLIDEGLQRRIAKANNLDKDAMDTLQLLLMDPPIPKTKELEKLDTRHIEWLQGFTL